MFFFSPRLPATHGYGSRRHRLWAGVGEHEKRRDLAARKQVLWQHEAGQIYERRRRPGGGIPLRGVNPHNLPSMHSNQKLTKIIAGRTISGTSQADGLLTITLDDGSTMRIKVAPSNANTAATGGKIAKVRQQDVTISLDLEDGSAVRIETADASSSVMVRDKAGAMEYAG